MNEELRIQRCEQYGSFLYCPRRDTLCFGRYSDKECDYDSCILDDPEYQKLKKTIEKNRMKRRSEKEKGSFFPPDSPKVKTGEAAVWDEIHAKEAQARLLYRKNKPKIADGLMAEALYMRRYLVSERRK